jgi:hypothetical protein
VAQTISDTESNLRLEQYRLERQKAAIDALLKRRELRAGRRTGLLSTLTNPLSLAIVGGFITAMTTVVTSTYTALQNRDLEQLKAANDLLSAREILQADLIKKFVEGPTLEAVRENLTFLVDAGLIPTYEDAIRTYLNEKPDSAPTLTLSGGITGPADDAVPITALPADDPLIHISKSVGQVMVLGSSSHRCTGFLVSPSIALTAGHCVPPSASLTFVLGNDRVSAVPIDYNRELTEPSYAILRLERPIEAPVLAASMEIPMEGALLDAVLYRWDNTPFGVSSPDCQVMEVGEETFEHLCDTGPGSSGAPIVLRETGEVLGVHAGRRTNGRGWATRITAIPTDYLQ